MTGVRFINPEKLSPTLVEEMNAYAAYLAHHFPGSAVAVHVDYEETGHAENSKHYLGEAVDFHVVGVPPIDAWLALERFLRFGGIGYYPDWLPTPGFHADVRVVPYRARWACVGRGAQKQYVAMDRTILQQTVTV